MADTSRIRRAAQIALALATSAAGVLAQNTAPETARPQDSSSPTATALVETASGAPAAGLRVRWAWRDPRAPHRLALRETTTDARGRARLEIDGPWSGPAHLLIVEESGSGALASVAIGDATRVRLAPTGTARIAPSADAATATTAAAEGTDAPQAAPVLWALSSEGRPVPPLEGAALALPPGRYVGLLASGGSLQPCAFDVRAGETVEIARAAPERLWSAPAGSPWKISPRGRAEIELDGTGPLGLPRNPEARLDCWRTRDGVVEVRPWPGDEADTDLRRLEFAGDERVVAVTPHADGRGWTLSGPGHPVQVPVAATSVILFGTGVWHWPATIEPGTTPLRIEMPQGRSLELVVTGADAGPLAGATVTWHPMRLGGDPDTLRRRSRTAEPVASAVTDARGIARLEHTAGAEGLLFVDHPRALPQWIEVGDRDRLFCSLEAGGSIRGRVVGGRGLGSEGGVAGVRVWARSTDRGLLQPPRWGDTDAEGRFAISGLDPELRYTVTVHLLRGVDTFSARAVRVAPDGDDALSLSLETEDPPLPGARGGGGGR